MAWIWKSALLVITGMILLRIAGRKSISQMSVATTVIMISIGTTIVQPIANNRLWIAAGSAAVFIVVLIIIEYLQVKFDWFEKIMTAKSKVVIENGQLVPDNLRAIRMTVDQLEMRLRQQGISNITDVKTATLESNGQVGYELMRHAKPLTIGEFERLLGLKSDGAVLEQSILFQEVKQNRNPIPIDPNLQ
ncbi:membrane protein [Paenibacillus sp. A3]|nr:membrane protein [Paenibacillus sp. A3]